jgi:hypothetical protein
MLKAGATRIDPMAIRRMVALKDEQDVPAKGRQGGQARHSQDDRGPQGGNPAPGAGRKLDAGTDRRSFASGLRA